MNAHRQVFSSLMQMAMSGRAEGFVWFLIDILPMLGFMAFWTAAAGQESIGGYTSQEFFVYYLGGVLISSIFTPHPDGNVIEDIQKGTLSQFLLRPYSYISFEFIGELAWKSIHLFYLLPLFIVLSIWGREAITQAVDVGFLLPGLLALVISYLISYWFRFIIGLLAFWLVETWAWKELFMIVQNVFSGEYFPLSFFPAWLANIAGVLPFGYIFFFPMQVFLGKLSWLAVWQGLVGGVLWVVVLYLVALFLYFQGLKRYEAVGG